MKRHSHRMACILFCFFFLRSRHVQYLCTFILCNGDSATQQKVLNKYNLILDLPYVLVLMALHTCCTLTCENGFVLVFTDFENYALCRMQNFVTCTHEKDILVGVLTNTDTALVLVVMKMFLRYKSA